MPMTTLPAKPEPEVLVGEIVDEIPPHPRHHRNPLDEILRYPIVSNPTMPDAAYKRDRSIRNLRQCG